MCAVPGVGCRSKESSERVAPWRAEGPEAASERAPLSLSVSGASSLRFSLPAPKGVPRGELVGLEGTFETDLFDLAQTRGTLRVPLDRMRIEAEGLGTDEPRTLEGLRWLGLGAKSPSRERHRFARLEVSQLRKVRPLRPAQGEPISDAAHPGLLVRRVRAEALGHLIVRGLGVDVEVPLSLDFFYRSLDEAPPVPEKVVARLDAPLRVSLIEHEISPRDESGVVDANELTLLGSSVGKTALVEGTLELFSTVR